MASDDQPATVRPCPCCGEALSSLGYCAGMVILRCKNSHEVNSISRDEWLKWSPSRTWQPRGPDPDCSRCRGTGTYISEMSVLGKGQIFRAFCPCHNCVTRDQLDRALGKAKADA